MSSFEYGKSSNYYAFLALGGMIPLLSGVFLGVAYSDWFWEFFITGFLLMFADIGAIIWYSVSSNQSIMQHQADIDYTDGSQGFCRILYKEEPLCLGTRLDQGITRYLYMFKDLRKNIWLQIIDHPLGNMAITLDKATRGYTRAKMVTQKGHYQPNLCVIVHLHPDDDDYYVPGFFAEHLLRKKEHTTCEVRIIYGWATAAKMKLAKEQLTKDFLGINHRLPMKQEDTQLEQKLISLGLKMPVLSAENIAWAYSSYDDFTHKEERTENTQWKEYAGKLEKILEDTSDGWIETHPPKVENKPMLTTRQILLLIGGIAAVVFAILLVYHFMFG